MSPNKHYVSLKTLFGLFILSIFIGNACKSSSKNSKKNEQTAVHTIDSLLWINGIDDPQVNYFQMVESFEAYWKGKNRPTEENGEAKDLFYKEDSLNDASKNKNIDNDMVFEYKRFLNWQQRTKNLVKPDGTIITNEEIYNNWKSKKDTLK